MASALKSKLGDVNDINTSTNIEESKFNERQINFNSASNEQFREWDKLEEQEIRRYEQTRARTSSFDRAVDKFLQNPVIIIHYININITITIIYYIE